MRVKSLAIVIVLNIFLMLFISVIYEYIDLSERFESIQNTVSSSFDSALRTSTASEELFSAQAQEQYISSYGYKLKNSGSYNERLLTHSSLILFKNGVAYQANTYGLAQYYAVTGALPATAGDFQSSGYNSQTLNDVYQYMFGQIGQNYTDNSLLWANRNQNTIDKISYSPEFSSIKANHRSVTNTDFADYYNNIGYSMRTKTTVKHKTEGTTPVYDEDGNYLYLNPGRYEIVEQDIPTLAQMGLDFNSVDPITGKNWNVLTDYTNDNLCMSFHIGKQNNNYNSPNSTYFLTPYSLGVTYVPVDVLKSTFVATLDTRVKLEKISSADITGKSFANLVQEAEGCIGTNVYVGGGATSQVHTLTGGEQIVNDGNVEYDLSSIQVKVDYFKVNFWDTANMNIVTKIEGSISGYDHASSSVNNLLAYTVGQVKATDTGRLYYQGLGLNPDDYTSGERLVARVSCRIKVHIPYHSSIIQWLCYKDGSSNHYDVKMYNPATGGLDVSDDGVWYEYTTYYSNTR